MFLYKKPFDLAASVACTQVYIAAKLNNLFGVKWKKIKCGQCACMGY